MKTGQGLVAQRLEQRTHNALCGQHDAGDRRNRDALAARGYWQALQLVKKEVEKVIAGENPAALARSAHNDWYRELFQPCVTAGLLVSRRRKSAPRPLPPTSHAD